MVSLGKKKDLSQKLKKVDSQIWIVGEMVFIGGERHSTDRNVLKRIREERKTSLYQTRKREYIW